MDYHSNTNPSKTEDDEDLKQLKNSLPNEPWSDSNRIYLYQGYWTPMLNHVHAFANHFQSQDTDIITASFRKVGTTWLKALVFAIRHRANHPPSNSNNPLLTHNPHKLVPHLESNIYAKSKCPNLSIIESPRLFGTHVPFPSLPSSIKESKCKIIYIFRNPLDTFVSSWLFYQNVDDHKSNLKIADIGQFFDMFCQGKVPYGPFPEHVLGYWNASLEWPEKVLFVKYEDLKANPNPQLKRMAAFLGCPFTEEEEEGGLIDDIVNLCSLEKLKEVATCHSKSDRVYVTIQNDMFFRKGVVGDWVNYLTPSMAERLEKIVEEKFCGSGLTFKGLQE